MTKRFDCRALILSLLLMTLPLAAAEEMQLLPRLEVEDGDTLLVVLDGKRQRVQLAGIDAPEDGDNPKYQRDLQRTGLAGERLLALGRAATEHLRQLTKTAAPFALHYDPQRLDRYGRLLVDILDSQGRSLAESLVAAGFAMATEPQPGKLRQLQVEAQRQGLGVWGLDPEAALAWAGIPTTAI